MNESGLYPIGVRVVVLPDEVEEKVGSIYMPDTVRDKERMAQVKATVVAMGGNAFDGIDGMRPDIGSRVYVGKYAGIHKVGKDEKYQVVNDEDIIAVIKE